jgi:hypothetical protein
MGPILVRLAANESEDVRYGSNPVLTAEKRRFRSTPRNGHHQTGPAGPFGATFRLMHVSTLFLFDDLVGTRQHRNWYVQSNFVGGLRIYDEFIFGRCLYGKFVWSFPF